MLIRRELSELRQNYFTVKKMRDFPKKKKKKKRGRALSSDKGSNKVHRRSSFRVHNTHSTALLFSKITLHKDHTVCHPALSYSWAYSHQVLVSLARYYGRSCNVASDSRLCMCSYYSPSPPASFCYTASSGCSHRVVHDGACACQWRYSCSRYISVLYGAFQSYARTLYAEIIPYDEEARWHGPRHGLF